MITFAVKHAVAAVVLIIGAAVSITALYFALLAWAIVSDGGLGGPLALPGMVLVTVAAAVISIVLFLFPVTSMAELLRSRILRVNRLAEIPISSLILLAYLATVITVAAVARHWSVGGSIRGGLIAAAVELLLLGAYWWSLQATSAIVSLITLVPRFLLRGRRARSSRAVLVLRA